MSSLAVCETVLESSYVRTDDGWKTLQSLLYRFAIEDAWQLAADVTVVEGQATSQIRDRYLALANEHPRVAEWLDYLALAKGVDAFEETEIEPQPTFADSLAEVAMKSICCEGLVTRRPQRYAKVSGLLSCRVLNVREAEGVIKMSNGGNTYNFGDNAIFAGRDMSQVYQSISQTHSPDIANALAEISLILKRQGDAETREQFSEIVQQVESGKPRQAIIGPLWQSIVEKVPQALSVATGVAGLAGLLGIS